MKKSKELVSYVLSLIGSGYVYGVNGKKVTESLIQAKAKQYPEVYSGKKIVNGKYISYVEASRKWIGKIAYDCSSIVDTFVGSDQSANSWYLTAEEKGKINLDKTKGKILLPPEIPGLIVHMNGHMGVYIGNGYVVQARGVLYGVVKTKLDLNNWTGWAKCTLIDYSDDSPVESNEPEELENEIPESAVMTEKRPTRTVSFGARGDDVVWVQNKLIAAGFEEIGLADGRFGEKTLAGVKDFQKKFRLVIDGKVGEKTRTKLDNPVLTAKWKNTYKRPEFTLVRGAKGKAVLWVQTVLKRAGYEIDIDGSFGALTERVVRLFQGKNNLAVDGRVGDKTLAKLDTYNK